eukprot:TRINITY_DN827_c0_g1_i1.p4 TRINITY_DN827_c0_g1~~TRINITY_DN827_c0_g1_i1.p4  ORF type:complete len:532 (+),score=76.56 TRINITY_DN827_c0_g1_i1:13227-14822(+)
MNEVYRNKDMSNMANDYIGAIIEKNKDDPKRLIQDLGVVRSHLEKEVNPILGNPPAKERELRTPIVGGLGQIPGYSKQSLKNEGTKLPPMKPKPKPAPRESQQPAPRESQLPVYQEEEPAPIRPPPQPVQSQVYPPAPPPNWMSMYNPPVAQQTDPMLLHSLMEVKEKIAKTFEKNKNLEEELKKLKESKVETAKPFMSVVPTKPPTAKKEIELPTPKDTTFAQNEQRAEDLEAEEKALLNIAAQEYDALQLLSKLDPNSDLYKYKLQQYKDMSAYRAEIEKVLQRQRLERLRFDFEVQKKRVVGGPPQEDLGNVERLKKDSIVARLQKEHAAQAPDQSPFYDPTVGFNLGFDFAYNLPPDVAKLQAVYGVFAKGIPIIELQQAGPIPAKMDRDNKASCMMSFNKNFKDVPAIPEAQLIVELQGIDRNGQQFNIGWTFLDLFDAANKLKFVFQLQNENSNGLHKLVVLRPPTLDHVDLEDMSELMRLQDVTLYARIAHAQGDYTSAAAVTPANKVIIEEILNKYLELIHNS